MHLLSRIQALVILHGRDVQSRSYLKNVTILNLVTLSWISLRLYNDKDLIPRGFHGSEVEDKSEKIFIFGGINNDGFLSTDIVTYTIDQIPLK